MWLEGFLRYSLLLKLDFFSVYLQMFKKYLQKLRLFILRNALITARIEIVTLFTYNNKFLQCPELQANAVFVIYSDTDM